jgi:N-methylhydantoinase A/oxoprolinase/acetone carboxylase beta subunit
MRRIGIDVGGTNTDAVLLEEGRVVRAVKSPTTEDVTGGILAALDLLRRHPQVTQGRIDGVVIGTTHFINAVVQRRHLAKIAAVRIGMPAAASLPPFCDWPRDLAAQVAGETFMLEGGHDYDVREIMPFDEAAMRAAAQRIREMGISSVGIAAIFSPLDPSHEERAAAILAADCPGVSVTLSHKLGRIGLLERENAALLNAALGPLAKLTIDGFKEAIAASHIDAPLYLTQNDGTVMPAEVAMALPVMSFASGATNSMRGAAFLSGLKDAMVVDVGGTSSDVGQLRNGFPREANSVVEIGDVRTLFRMPDLYSIGLGGGSIVRREPLAVGPGSVGYRLTREALVFGGATLTATDAAVKAGIAEIGDASKVGDLPRDVADAVLGQARDLLEDAIDRMKTEAGDPGHARRLRQRGRRRGRASQRRDRPDLPRHDPRRGDRRGRGASRRARPRRRRRPCDDRHDRDRGHAARLSAGERAAGPRAGGGGDGKFLGQALPDESRGPLFGVPETAVKWVPGFAGKRKLRCVELGIPVEIVAPGIVQVVGREGAAIFLQHE